MKVKRLPWLLWFISLGVIVSVGFAHSAQGPKMVLPEREFSFGEIQEGQVIEHAFKVMNQGDQELKIVRVRPG